MKISTAENLLVVWDKGEPIACWDSDANRADIDDSLDEDGILNLVGTLLSLIHEYISGDSLPIPENASDIPYHVN